MKSIKNRLIGGASYNVVNTILFSGSQLIVVPFMLTGFGTSQYEIWILTVSFLNLISVFDLAFSSYLSVKIRSCIALSKRKSADFWISQALGFYVFVFAPAIFVIFTILLLVYCLVFSGPDALSSNSIITYFVLLITYVILLPRTLVIHIFSASGDFKAEAKNSVVLNLAQMSALILSSIIFSSTWLLAVLFMSFSVVVGWSFTIAQLRGRLEIGHSVRVCLPRLRLVGGILKSFPTYSAASLTRFGYQLLPLALISVSALPTGSVTAYHVMRVYVGVLRQVILQVGRILGLEAARLQFSGNGDASAALLRKAIMPLLGVSVVSSLGLVSLSESFFRLWTGDALSANHLLLVTLSLGTALASPLMLQSIFLVGIGRPILPAVNTYLSLAAGVAIAALSMSKLGIIGVAIGFSVSEVVIHYALLAKKLLESAGMGLAEFVKKFIFRMFLVLPSILAVSAVHFLVSDEIPSIYTLGFCVIILIIFAPIVLLPEIRVFLRRGL